jgi:hypothetical protein
MIVWVAAFAGLIWCWYMESEKHQRAVERREIDRMADDSRRNRPELRRLEKRRVTPSRSARWATKSPRLAGRG